MDYGKALRIARAVSGLQQKDIAVRSRLDPSYVSLIEKGLRVPSGKAVTALSKAFKMPESLFNLLATEKGDLSLSEPGQLEEIGKSLAKLVVQTKRQS